jgi:hypothetical protein
MSQAERSSRSAQEFDESSSDLVWQVATAWWSGGVTGSLIEVLTAKRQHPGEAPPGRGMSWRSIRGRADD